MKLYKQSGKSGFEQVPNELIRTASFKAIGLWAFMAQLPDDWEFSIAGLTKIRSEGRDAIRSAVEELEKLGWLARRQSKDSSGKYDGYDYELHWYKASGYAENPTTENPTTEKPTTENPTQYNTEQITNRTNKRLNQNNNSYVPPATQEPLPQEALDLADLLKEKILKNQPTAKIDKNYQKNWAKDIEKAHRIDGRSWNQLRGAITYAQDYSDFWGMNIRSGAKLRKHYDRLEADLRRLYNQRGIMIAGKPQNGSEGAENEFNVPF